MQSLLARVSLIVAALSLWVAPALGQTGRDDAANKSIREAIDTHYLATHFDKAEAVLTSAIQTCGKGCSPRVLARVWMYLGLIRGSGKNDLVGAKQAFERAVAIDPAVELDAQMATPETQKAFQDAGGAAPAAPAAPASTTEPPAEAAREPSAPVEPEPKPKKPAIDSHGLDCTPKGNEVETRRPIPIECQSEEPVDSLELRFKTPGDNWQSLPMVKKGEGFRAEIPCTKTEVSGALLMFVRAKDTSGDEVAGWGTKQTPIEVSLVETSNQKPPSFEDMAPPARCGAREDCPPNFPGCDTAAKNAGKSQKGRSFAENWFGLHVAQDITFIGGSDICSQASQASNDFSCYYAGSRTGAYVDDPYPGTDTSTALALATTRILVSYDRALSSHVLAGVRVGYALGGGPPSGRDVAYDSSGRITQVYDEGLAFLPYHLEARASYFFGSDPLARMGFRPYVHLGGGLAQVDGKTTISAKDCGLVAPRGDPTYTACANGTLAASDSRLRSVDLDAWKKLGQGFVTIGGGTIYGISSGFGVALNLNLMYMLPGSGVVLEPSIGAVYGL